MSVKTSIEWTDHTFNIAWGCVKVSPGCKFCYAENESKRYGFDVWGPGNERRTFGDKYWANPIKWNAAAESEGVRKRVFCSSMADVFEDHAAIEAERAKLWPLIERTPMLDWQILTKRAERMRDLSPRMPLSNVWFGVSVEDQATADDRIPILLQTPAAVRFVSYEPALGPVDFREVPCHPDQLPDDHSDSLGARLGVGGAVLEWIIVGGESGPHARPFDVAWARSTIKQCKAAGVACFYKQGGSSNPCLHDRKGGCFDCFPADLKVREFPQT